MGNPQFKKAYWTYIISAPPTPLKWLKRIKMVELTRTEEVGRREQQTTEVSEVSEGGKRAHGTDLAKQREVWIQMPVEEDKNQERPIHCALFN